MRRIVLDGHGRCVCACYVAVFEVRIAAAFLELSLECAGNRNRTMSTAGTAYTNGQVRLSLLVVQREQVLDEVENAGKEVCAPLAVEHVFGDIGLEATAGLQVLLEVRVGQAAQRRARGTVIAMGS